MFTGLIQDLGTLKIADQHRLRVICPNGSILHDLEIGDSIAVDGACLTVETIVSHGFVVTASPETLNRTTLELQAETAAWVNLESSLRLGSKVGGHFVTGHIDGVGQVEAIAQTTESWEISFAVPAAIARFIVAKGSIAVNGISLTVADCNLEGSWFKAAVIPHSFANTNLRYLQLGSLVNLETDLLGKYAAKLLQPHLNSSQPDWASPFSAITPEFLTEHGFM